MNVGNTIGAVAASAVFLVGAVVFVGFALRAKAKDESGLAIAQYGLAALMSGVSLAMAYEAVTGHRSYTILWISTAIGLAMVVGGGLVQHFQALRNRWTALSRREMTSQDFPVWAPKVGLLFWVLLATAMCDGMMKGSAAAKTGTGVDISLWLAVQIGYRVLDAIEIRVVHSWRQQSMSRLGSRGNEGIS